MFPTLYSKQLVLRQIEQDDIGQVFKGLSDEAVIQYYGVSYTTLAATQAQINWHSALYTEQTGIWWGVCTRSNPTLIGACGINNLSQQHRKAEIGFWLLSEFWNQGFMYEAATVCIDFVFREMRIHRLEAFVEVPNLASAKLLQKLGFRQEGIFRDYEFKNGQYINLALYARLCTDLIP